MKDPDADLDAMSRDRLVDSANWRRSSLPTLSATPASWDGTKAVRCVWVPTPSRMMYQPDLEEGQRLLCRFFQ
jgi:hypothetical protein